MKVMICENCENTISEDYLETVVDVSVNEDGIKTYYEHPQRCQCCGGIYVEAETCFVCGTPTKPPKTKPKNRNIWGFGSVG